MAIFLLIYLIILALWFVWSFILIMHLLKFRFPKDRARIYLALYLIICGFILAVSALFIASADWVSVPDAMKELGV